MPNPARTRGPARGGPGLEPDGPAETEESGSTETPGMPEVIWRPLDPQSPDQAEEASYTPSNTPSPSVGQSPTQGNFRPSRPPSAGQCSDDIRTEPFPPYTEPADFVPDEVQERLYSRDTLPWHLDDSENEEWIQQMEARGGPGVVWGSADPDVSLDELRDALEDLSHLEEPTHVTSVADLSIDQLVCAGRNHPTAAPASDQDHATPRARSVSCAPRLQGNKRKHKRPQ
ncbi:hypothetical protein ACRALDRAFT_1071547 [Sodiomyces alcalophilus JCM 7366]|uniref:uncharacterized protein n=1 Tax=Sodiomyces alcalophilus JCM 7366 TaxID=591952 RepID=UPI0039B3F09A